MPSHAKKTLTADICVPEGFKWMIECKGGYEKDVNLNSFEKIPKLDEWIKTAERDSEGCGRPPVICWKQNRKPWIAVLRENLVDNQAQFTYRFYYKDWLAIRLDHLLKATDRSYWFTTEKASE